MATTADVPSIAVGSLRRQTTKKWTPTQHGGNGHVSGVESMNRKNAEKHGEWGSMRFTPHFWPILPALALFKGIKFVSDVKCQTFGSVKDSEAVEIPNRTITRKLHVGAVSLDDLEARRGLKTDRVASKHMKSDCATDREMWQRCVKDRYNSGVDCSPFLQQFKQCQNGAQ
jgi:hypothetical protein